jgi:hypothetical protein
MAGDYAAGLDWGHRAVRQNPDLVGGWRALALSAAMLGHLEEAQEAVARARQLQPTTQSRGSSANRRWCTRPTEPATATFSEG